MVRMSKDYALPTRLAHIGHDPASYHGLVAPPVARGSTFLYPDLETYRRAAGDPDHRYRYWRLGNPNADAFERAMAELEGGHRAVAAVSGVAACALPFLAHMRAGAHVLVVDGVYDQIRDLCGNVLARAGVEVEYYDPLIGAGVAGLIRESTALVYIESPGSATFEVQDVPAIAAAARARGVLTVADNTWSSPLAFRPLEHGVDVCVVSATKYIGGHADITLGVAVARDEATYRPLKTAAVDMGYSAGAEDMVGALRGLRTVQLRYRQAAASALRVARWLDARPEVVRVCYPPLPSDPGHALWRRDFDGAAGILSLFLDAPSDRAVRAFVDALDLFPIGSSWGGYESLLQPQSLAARSFAPKDRGTLLRLQIGLEDPADLIACLERGFAAMTGAQ